jgi:hypothetical protein
MLQLAVILCGVVGLVGIVTGVMRRNQPEKFALSLDEQIAKKAGGKAPAVASDASIAKARSSGVAAIVLGIVMVGVGIYANFVILKG